MRISRSGPAAVLGVCTALLLTGCEPAPPPADAIEPAAHPASAAAQAAKPVPSDASPAATKPFEMPDAGCGFAAVMSDPDVRIHAAGAYAGTPSGFQIDESGHEATLMRVAVNTPGQRVALMLGAYEPTVWSVGWTAGTQIVAVLATGYHDQRVSGLPAGTPLTVSTYQGGAPCGHTYVSAQGARGLDAVAQRAFGRGVDAVHIAKDGRAVIGPGASTYITDAQAQEPAAFAAEGTLPAGDVGLQAALRDGLLRRATPADAQAWQAAARRSGVVVGQDVIEHGTQPMMADRSFTILKPFRFPAGLFGAHLAVFYLAPGVPEPTGDPGHSLVYDIASGTCRGAMCRLE